MDQKTKIVHTPNYERDLWDIPLILVTHVS